jgi:hypothetical protein
MKTQTKANIGYFMVFAMVIVGIYCVMHLDNEFIEKRIRNAEEAAIGHPMSFDHLPQGEYLVEKLVSKDTAVLAIVSETGEKTDSFLLVKDVPKRMMEEGHNFTTGGLQPR